MKVKTAVLASEYKFGGSSERLVGSNGELNASSKRDLIAQQLKLVNASARGEVATMDKLQKAAKARQLIEAMMSNDAVHKEVGEVMAKDLYAAANRRGFARKFLARQDLVNGQEPKVKLRKKDVTVV
jgi:hypothetical protein